MLNVINLKNPYTTPKSFLRAIQIVTRSSFLHSSVDNMYINLIFNLGMEIYPTHHNADDSGARSRAWSVSDSAACEENWVREVPVVHHKVWRTGKQRSLRGTSTSDVSCFQWSCHTLRRQGKMWLYRISCEVFLRDCFKTQMTTFDLFFSIKGTLSCFKNHPVIVLQTYTIAIHFG